MTAQASGGHYLFVVFLGGDFTDRIGEDHEVVLVTSPDEPSEVRRRARAKWMGSGRPHVDVVVKVERIDGYEVTLRPTELDDDVMAVDRTYEPD